MEAEPEKTRSPMRRHRALVEGAFNNLKNHQGARTALWKGHALARLQLGLVILLAHALKWHKVNSGQLQPVQLKPRKPTLLAS